jgi:hypothetical protein
MATKKGPPKSRLFSSIPLQDILQRPRPIFCNTHARYFVTPTPVMLNLFQHLNFGPEADLEGWVIGQPYRLAQLQTEAQAIS